MLFLPDWAITNLIKGWMFSNSSHTYCQYSQIMAVHIAAYVLADRREVSPAHHKYTQPSSVPSNSFKFFTQIPKSDWCVCVSCFWHTFLRGLDVACIYSCHYLIIGHCQLWFVTRPLCWNTLFNGNSIQVPKAKGKVHFKFSIPRLLKDEFFALSNIK